MYEQYWRLERPAFESDFDPEFFSPARSHQGALLKLRYLVENGKELGVLVGDHGLGKTYLTHVLEQVCRGSGKRFVRIVFPMLTPSELLRYVALQLGVVSMDDEQPQTVDVILGRLEQSLQGDSENPTRPVVVVDDAHLLDGAHLQTLQLLLNLRSGRSGFTLILVGRSDLLPRIKRLPPLADRVSVQTLLQPLTADETHAYVSHRLKVAGVLEEVLNPGAAQAAWELSRGIPRLVNQICDLSLLVGYADGLRCLSPVEVHAAAEELGTVSAE